MGLRSRLSAKSNRACASSCSDCSRSAPPTVQLLELQQFFLQVQIFQVELVGPLLLAQMFPLQSVGALLLALMFANAGTHQRFERFAIFGARSEVKLERCH